MQVMMHHPAIFAFASPVQQARRASDMLVCVQRMFADRLRAADMALGYQGGL